MHLLVLHRLDAGPVGAGERLGLPVLVLPLEGGAIVLDEGADLVGHAQEARPLLRVERDREAPQPVDAQAPFSETFIEMPLRAPALSHWFSASSCARRCNSSSWVAIADGPPLARARTGGL